MRQEQGRRAPVQNVEGGAGARIDLEEPPAFTLDQQIGAGQTREARGGHDPADGLRHRLAESGGDRPGLVPAASQGTAVAERPQPRGRLPLFRQRQSGDAPAVGQKVEGEGSAGHAGLEIMSGRGGTGGADANMRAAAAPRALEEPRAPLRHGAGMERRVRDGEARAQGGEADRILQGRDRCGRRTEERETGRDIRDQIRCALEAAAENDADRPTRRLGQRGEPGEHGVAVASAGAEASGQRTMGFGEGQGILVAEQIEHVGLQPGPPGRLGQRPAGLGGDQDRAALDDAGRGQPAISTARV